ncbi:MAG: hypothetical protein JNG86_11520 [Verrucomicrobiaceae bacterium]|nr:hypothetical protein [Verrucomicrobiaceae bacterium]
MILKLHHLVFMLLPLALVVATVMRRPGDPRAQAMGALRFSAGFAKLVLLALPAWEVAALVVRGGQENLSASMAVICVVALMISLAFVWGTLRDFWAGLGGLLGFESRVKVLEARPGLFRESLLFLGLALVALVVLCGSVEHALTILKALGSSPVPTIAIWFQETRAWSNFHLVTLVAALAVFFGVPRTEDFLREWRPWKAVLCLAGFAAASAMLWTRFADLP